MLPMIYLERSDSCTLQFVTSFEVQFNQRIVTNCEDLRTKLGVLLCFKEKQK